MERLSKDTRLERVVEDAKLKASGKAEDEGPGWIEGYLAVFNNVDNYDERIIPGAFAKTIAERVPAGKCPLMSRHFAHGGDTLSIVGTITQAKEDAYGLWIHADLASTEDAQDLRTLILEGHVKGLSVGYQCITWDQESVDGKIITNLKELRLLEGTVTAFPVNEQAQITAAKATSRTAQASDGADLLALEAIVARCRVDLESVLI